MKQLLDLLIGCPRFLMVRVHLQSSSEEVFCLLDIHCTAHLLQLSQFIETVSIFGVMLQRGFEVYLSLFVLAFVIECSRQIEMALRGVRIQFQGQLV